MEEGRRKRERGEGIQGKIKGNCDTRATLHESFSLD